MNLIRAALRLLLPLAATLPAVALTPVPESPDPLDAWSLDFETGSLWRVSGNTFLDYTVLPQMISLRTPAHFRWDLGEGELAVRSRLTLLAEAVPQGPESLYLGFSASPSVEYWFQRGIHAGTTCLFASVGGGLGWIDSTGVPGGQGQDLTLNWFATAGLRYYLSPRCALSVGVMFQHWSNGGASHPNPGLDALGPVLGATFHF